MEPGYSFRFDERDWVCLSVAEYREKGTQYYWREYGLYDKSDSCLAWLNEFNGHWSIAYQSDAFQENARSGEYTDGNRRFLIFNKYSALFEYGYGEFMDDITSPVVYNASEYVNPPEMVTFCSNLTEIFSIEARYVSQKEMKAILPEKAELPSAVGVGALEPSTFYISDRTLRLFTIITVVILIAIEIVFNFTETEVKVGGVNVAVDTAMVQPKVPFVIRDIDLPKSYNNIEVRIAGNLNNEWVEVEGSLISADGRDVADFGTSLEYYSGYEDGESWSEGSNANEVFLPAIEKGNYMLDGDVNFSGKRFGNFVAVEVYANVGYFSNLWFLLALVLIYPGYVLARRHIKNKARWANSDYAYLHFNQNDD
ncbi:MAG: DUF4178 domain-containing protein [Bacteroidetes bacterium]|nr:DUF4178 domain-containing protein [Bacteroidota bacterium]